MDARFKWCHSIVLIWLLAAKTAFSAPRPTQLQTRSFVTQYPPAIKGDRVLVPETEGFYPTKLEREGHDWDIPTPPPSQGGFLLEDLLNNLNHADSLLNWLLPPELNPTIPITPPGVPPAPETSKPDIPPETSGDIAPIPSETDGPESSVPSADSTSTTTSDTAPDITTTSFSEETASSSESQDSITSPVQVTTEPTSSITTSELSSVIQGSMSAMASQDVFVPLATGPIPAVIKSRDDHPVSKHGIRTTVPVETNKFYAGLFLGTQTNATFTHPYSLAWAKGSGPAESYGMAVSHVEAGVVANGPANSDIPGHPISYYINPIGLQSMILSGAELGESTILDAENPLPFSANAVFRPKSGSSKTLTIPIVQGMGYVTGIYSQMQPLIQSGVQFRNVVTIGSPKPDIYKYRATLEDGSTWLIYVIPGSGYGHQLKLESNTTLRGPSGWSGTIQIAKNPAGADGGKFFDNSAGVYAIQGAVTGSVNNRQGTYQLSWTKAGIRVASTPLLMFALPHHVAAFDQSTKGRITNITLRTTTKGRATAVVGETWTMIEPNLPIDMGFAPWSPTSGTTSGFSTAAKSVIMDVAGVELQQNIEAQTNLNSMYYSGKALSKFATMIYTVDRLVGQPARAASALQQLKQAFARFAENRQQFPLVYDTVWKGVVSSAGYGGDPGADFGNTYYNDHHFHYGYFIHAAAIIGTLDPSWIPSNKAWVNMLIRDSGNSASDDPLFPFSRAFDWFNGHSWAKGLFESYDGKDQESTSEDTMFAYALKMWGKTIGDASLEARGNLMLGILRRSLHNYFLMDNDNKNQPSNFIANKVTGILFENKVDHTTYFGNNMEYVQGIHMLPLLPCSGYVRRHKFVQQEWDALFAQHAAHPAQNVQGGWKGVLFANQALVNPTASWNFFSQPNFDYSWIDGGASRTWYLANAAGLGGGPTQ